MFEILEECCTPKRGTKYSAYVDLFSAEDVTIGAGETKIVRLGVKLDLEKLLNNVGYTERTPTLKDRFLNSHYLEVALRSSLGVKGLIIANGIGIIDLDYPDEIGLIVHNPLKLGNNKTESLVNGQTKATKNYYTCKNNLIVKKGDKVAQCTLKEHKGYLMGYETETLRTGGFGSTDNKEEAPNFDKPDFFKCNVVN